MGLASVPELFARACAAEQRRDWAVAGQLYQQAETQDPGNHRLPANRGNALWMADAPFEALRALQRAVTLAPSASLPWRGLGNVLRDLNRFEAADAAYRRSSLLEADPFTDWNHSQTLIGLERYPMAFQLAEQRWQLPEFPLYRAKPDWRDWPLCRRLTIFTEQGFGDTFQYLRWLVPLSQWGLVITLEVELPLVALMRQGLAWLPCPPMVVAKQSEPPLLRQAHGSLLSLPHLLGGAPLATTLKPGEAYLRSPRWMPPRTRHRSRHPQVGLVWAAGRKCELPFTERDYRRRSLPTPPLEALLQGLVDRGAELTNVHFGADRDQARHLGHLFGKALDPQADFAEAALTISQLDLVISVDTATAHLVGAMGRPGWVLLPWSADPRWLRQRADSPWYPSLFLIRQPSPGDWNGLVQNALDHFSRWLGRYEGLGPVPSANPGRPGW